MLTASLLGVYSAIAKIGWFLISPTQAQWGEWFVQKYKNKSLAEQALEPIFSWISRSFCWLPLGNQCSHLILGYWQPRSQQQVRFCVWASLGQPAEGEHQSWEGGVQAGWGTWLMGMKLAFLSGVTQSSLSEGPWQCQGRELPKPWLLFLVSDVVWPYC